MSKPSYYELFVSESLNPENKEYLCVKLSTNESITYFQISSLKPEEITNIVHNNTPYKISIRSKSLEEEPIQEIEAKAKIFYIQNLPNNPRAGSIIQVAFQNTSQQQVTIEIDIMIITTAPRHFDCGEPDKMIQVTVRFIGAHKVIEILQVSRAQLLELTQEKPDEVLIIKYSYNIIDISFMHLATKYLRKEVANLYLKDTAGILEIRNMTNITLKGFIDHFQMDNNSDKKTTFPVVFRKVNEKLRKNIEKKKFLEWSIAFENPSMSSHWYISNLALGLGNLEVMLEEEYLDVLLKYSVDLSERINREKDQKDFNFIQRKYFDKIDLEDEFDYNKKIWEFIQIDKRNNYVFIENMCLPKIRCLLSYYQDPSSTIDKDFALVSLIGVAVGGFESASIEIKGFHKE